MRATPWPPRSLTRAGVELAAAAASVIARLDMRGEAFPTVLAGGIFRGVPSLSHVTSRLAEVAPRSDVRLLESAGGRRRRLALAAARGRLIVPAYL